MLLKTPIIATVLLLAAGYAASPCLTLYRLHDAIRAGDTATVARLVDWDSVREGLDEQIADAAADVEDPKAISSGAQLAPFGFSFMRGVASRAMDSQVTAPKLLTLLHNSKSAFSLRIAYFDSLTEFIVRLAAAHGQGIRLRLNFEDGQWKVTRIWVPRSMIRRAKDSSTIEAAFD